MCRLSSSPVHLCVFEVEAAKAKGLPIPSRDRGSPYAPPVDGLEPVIVRQ